MCVSGDWEGLACLLMGEAPARKPLAGLTKPDRHLSWPICRNDAVQLMPINCTSRAEPDPYGLDAGAYDKWSGVKGFGEMAKCRWGLVSFRDSGEMMNLEVISKLRCVEQLAG
jgi:hypothetical protein